MKTEVVATGRQPRLLRNAAECRLCGDVIESKHVHDYRRCRCGTIIVDGGLEYSRYGWSGAESNWIDRREWTNA